MKFQREIIAASHFNSSFCIISLGGHFEIPISRNMHDVNLENCGNMLVTFCTEMRKFDINWLCALVIAVMMFRAFFFSSNMGTEVFSAFVHCRVLLSSFAPVRCYINKLSIASFNFMYVVMHLYAGLFGCL